jgi:S1-C subfamily serine protease
VQDFSLTNINLAVPINEVVAAADRIISGNNKKIWFGIEQRAMTAQMQDMSVAPKKMDITGDGRDDVVDFGTLVTYVDPLSPADIAGIKAGDYIFRLDNKKIKYAYDWDSTVRDFLVGQLVNVDFARKNAAGVWQRMQAQVQILLKPEDKDKDKKEGTSSSSGDSYHHSMSQSFSGRNRNAVFPHTGGSH